MEVEVEVEEYNKRLRLMTQLGGVSDDEGCASISVVEDEIG